MEMAHELVLHAVADGDDALDLDWVPLKSQVRASGRYHVAC